MPRHERRVTDPRSVEWAGASTVVRNFRLLRNWSQVEAADWYGVSVRTWQRYESGQASVPTPLLKRITSFRDRTALGAEYRAYLTV